jgi:hypothetical protein
MMTSVTIYKTGREAGMLSTIRNTASAVEGASMRPASFLVALAVSLFAASSAARQT